jgi:hypothetical protein
MRRPKPTFDPIEEAYLHGHPNPERHECPGLEALRQLAANELPVSHPARLHIANCSPCFQEFRTFQRQMANERRRQRLLASAVAACLIVVATLTVKTLIFRRVPTEVAFTAHLKRTADLFDEPDALRGAEPQKPLKTIYLPPAPLQLAVILPRFSRPGVYQIAICRDRSENSTLVKAVGRAVADGPRQIVTVMLDLSGLSKGSYWLSTRSEDAGGSYYFPIHLGN